MPKPSIVKLASAAPFIIDSINDSPFANDAVTPPPNESPAPVGSITFFIGNTPILSNWCPEYSLAPFEPHFIMIF